MKKKQRPPLPAESRIAEDEILDVLGEPPVYDFEADNGKENLKGPKIPTWLKFHDETTLYVECSDCRSRIVVTADVESADVESALYEAMQELVNKAIAQRWIIVPSPHGPGGEETYCRNCVEQANPQPACPQCGCTQLTAIRRGYSVGMGIAGDLLLGPLGLIAGAIGADDIMLVCTNCRHTW